MTLATTTRTVAHAHRVARGRWGRARAWKNGSCARHIVPRSPVGSRAPSFPCLHLSRPVFSRVSGRDPDAESAPGAPHHGPGRACLRGHARFKQSRARSQGRARGTCGRGRVSKVVAGKRVLDARVARWGRRGVSHDVSGAAKRPGRRKRPAPEGFDEAPPPLPGPLLPAGEERERPSPSPPSSPLRPTGPSGPDGATAPRAYARSQASGASARRLREMNKWGEGQGEVGYGKAQLVNRMRHLVTAAARQARSLAPGARPTRWNQLR